MPRVLMCPEGPLSWGSSRLRVYWVAEKWDEAELLLSLDEKPDLDGVEVLITQHKTLKKPWDEFYKLCRSKGIKIVHDVCDPMFLFLPEAEAMAEHVDIIVASNDELANLYRESLRLPTLCIPDRHKVEAYTVKEHAETDCPILMWHGMALNRASLWNCAAELAHLWAAGFKFKVVVVDNAPDVIPHMLRLVEPHLVGTIPWQLESFYKEVLPTADVGLVPAFPGWWGTVKSSNKEVAFWMAGVPTVKGDDVPQLVRLLRDWELRATLGRELREMAVDRWAVERSVEDWQRLVSAIR